MATGPRPGSSVRAYRAPGGDWPTRAACKGRAPSHDAPLPGEKPAAVNARVAVALAVCAGCPVRQECKRWVMEQRREYRQGVMGGDFWPTIHPYKK